MSTGGATYGRTRGRALLMATYARIYGDAMIDPEDKIPPGEQSSYGRGDARQQARFLDVTRNHTTPPPFLKFDLAPTGAVVAYPGAVPGAQVAKAPTATLQVEDAEISYLNKSLKRYGRVLTRQRLEEQMPKFSGQVNLVELLPGRTIYRTIGLTAGVVGRANHVTNKLLGEYWEFKPPSSYPSIDAWRAATAVLWEWNGDYGYLQCVLARPTVALVGTTGPQHIARGDWWLPGGGQQVFFPFLTDDDLETRIGEMPIREVLQQTSFGS